MVSAAGGLPTFRWFKPNVKGKKPSARYFHAMAVLGEAVVVVGGKDDHNRFTDVHVFNKDERTSLWTQPNIKGSSPKPRSAHTISVVGSRIFVFGGHRDREKFNDVHVLDTENMTWLHPSVTGAAPMKRNAHTTTVVGRELYVFGGFHGESCNDLHVINTETMAWRSPAVRGDLPPPRCCHTTTNIDEILWVFAGKNNDASGVIERHNDLFSLDTHTLTWQNRGKTAKGVPPSQRNAHRYVLNVERRLRLHVPFVFLSSCGVCVCVCLFVCLRLFLCCEKKKKKIAQYKFVPTKPDCVRRFRRRQLQRSLHV